MTAPRDAVYIEKDEALTAARGAAWEEPADPGDATCGHPGCTEHPAPGRLRIHSIWGGIGADWDLTQVEDYIRDAQRCAWVGSFIGHELGVIGEDGRAIYFEVRRAVDAA
jgi:hypothetical protein